MKPSSRYVNALIVAIVLALGYVGVTQWQAAMNRRHERADAAADAQAAAEQAAGAALLQRIHVPPSVATTGAGSGCTPSVIALCLRSSQHPAATMNAVLPSLRALGMPLGPVSCKPPPQNTPTARLLAPPWTPCNVSVGSLSSGLSVSTFPMPDEARSRAGHLVFKGSSISISANLPL